ncbi:MAG: GspH/FimT family pseudopilin [Planctomycetota bacterium]
MQQQPHLIAVFERMSQKAMGFTMVELMIVVLIVGIVATMAVPEMTYSMASSKLSAGVNELITALRFAQKIALSSSTNMQVRIGAASDTFIVERFKPGSDLSVDLGSQVDEADVESGSYVVMEHPLIPGEDYSVDLSAQSWFGGVDITDVDFSGQNRVVFDALGFPSSGGTITVVYGSFEALITVDSLSGRVDVTQEGGKAHPMQGEGGAAQMK